MKRKIVAMLLAGGLTLGLCGCGSGGTSAEAPAPTPAEDVSVPEETEVAQEPESDETGARGEEPVKPEVAEPEVGSEAEGYSVDELMDMWSSGLLMREEIVEMAAAGEIDSDVFEEFLAQSEETSEDGTPTSDIDTSSLLTTHTIEFEDGDGYQIRETVQLSPIFREDDLETAHALWEALGNDVADFPSKEELYDVSWVFKNMRDRLGCNELEYVIGTYMVENLTDDFPITPDNPRSYDRRLFAERVLASDDEHDATAADIFSSSLVSVVAYPDGAIYYSDPETVTVGKPKMISDAWGPCAFIIVLPNKRTPNQLDGYGYDKIEISIGNKGYGNSGYDVFELTYYE